MGALTFLGTVATVTVTHRKNKRDEYAAKEKERLDRLAEKHKGEEATFTDVVKRLGEAQGTGDEASAASGRADVDLLTFTTPEMRRYHRRVFNVAVGILRSRETTVGGEGPDQDELREPTRFEQNVLSAFLNVLEPLRERAMDEKVTNIQKNARQLSRAQRRAAISEAQATPVLDASGVKLDRMDLVGKNLSNLNLAGASMRESNLSFVVIEDADLREVHMERVIAKNMIVSNCNVTGLKLKDANLGQSMWKKVNLKGTRLLAAARVKGAIIDGLRGLSENQIATLRKRGAVVKGGWAYDAPAESTPGKAVTVDEDELEQEAA